MRWDGGWELIALLDGAVQSCYRATVTQRYDMNVAIKISDDLAKRARHEAVDDGLSLSGWVSRLISEKLKHRHTNKSLLEVLGNDDLADLELEFPRNPSTIREINFQ